MNLDDQLKDVLRDDTWALPVRSDLMDGVRRGRRRRRVRNGVLSGALGLAVVAGGLSATSFDDHRSTLTQYAGSGVPQGSPAPGITPPFVPASGRDWLMTSAQYATYSRTHTHPSPPPGQSSVASPAPLGPQSAGLLAAVQAAGLPSGATLRREDSVGGQPGVAQVHVTLPDGSLLVVEQSQLSEPFDYESSGGDGTSATAPTVKDVPETSSAALVFGHPAYGLPDGSAADSSVIVISQGGVSTSWYAAAVSESQLEDWAFAAARH